MQKMNFNGGGATKLHESDIVASFTHILNLPNKTDGTLHIYKPEKDNPTKPDGYYYYEGITFILDAKAPNQAFTGQLESYMRLESNENFIGFKYSGKVFECYVKGVLKKDEIRPKDRDYYREKYFPQKINNENIVSKSAEKLANLFRNSKINKQILCGKDLKTNNLQRQDLQNPFDYKRFKISDLLVKIAKGKDKSPDKKQENKYLAKYPVVIAKKDNNGIDGTTDKPHTIYSHKFCIVSGGNGGGGKTYYCDFEFGATSFVMVCDLHAEFRAFADKFAKFYLAVIISERLFQTIQNGRTISEVPSDIDIKLPINSDGKIAWDYMSNFVKNLQYAEWV